MRRIVLSLALVITLGFLFEEESYAINWSANSIVYRNTSEIIRVSNMGKYRFLGQLRMGPYATSSSIHVYTDGYNYYCSDFPPKQVENRSEKELRESGIFHRIYKDSKGYWYNDYYGEKSYLYNMETYRIVQNIEREVYYQDWMMN